jgi:hypothetical protein
VLSFVVGFALGVFSVRGTSEENEETGRFLLFLFWGKRRLFLETIWKSAYDVNLESQKQNSNSNTATNKATQETLVVVVSLTLLLPQVPTSTIARVTSRRIQRCSMSTAVHKAKGRGTLRSIRSVGRCR